MIYSHFISYSMLISDVTAHLICSQKTSVTPFMRTVKWIVMSVMTDDVFFQVWWLPTCVLTMSTLVFLDAGVCLHVLFQVRFLSKAFLTDRTLILFRFSVHGLDMTLQMTWPWERLPALRAVVVSRPAVHRHFVWLNVVDTVEPLPAYTTTVRFLPCVGAEVGLVVGETISVITALSTAVFPASPPHRVCVPSVFLKSWRGREIHVTDVTLVAAA